MGVDQILVGPSGSIMIGGRTHRIPGVNVLGIVGSGANGTVFKAAETDLARTVALKVWHAPVTAESLSRALGEARKLASSPHLLVAAIHRFGKVGGWPFAIMEWVSGSTMAQWLLTKPSFWQRKAAWHLYSQAMSHLHENGVLHGDGHTKNVIMVEQPSAAYAKLHEIAGAGSIGLKLVDPGSSTLWERHDKFAARDARVLQETVDRLFPELGVDDLLDLHEISSRVALASLDCAVEYAAAQLQVREATGDYGIRAGLFSMVNQVVDVPLFQLARVFADVANLVERDQLREMFRRDLLGALVANETGAGAMVDGGDVRPSDLDRHYAARRRAYLRSPRSSHG